MSDYPGKRPDLPYLAILRESDGQYVWYPKRAANPSSPPLEFPHSVSTYEATGETVKRCDGTEAEIYELKSIEER